MSNDDHQGMKKIQVWIPFTTWEKINSLGYTSPTNAVTQGFKLLLETPPETPIGTPDNSPETPNVAALLKEIEGLRELVAEQKERIEDLRQDKETLSIFAHAFKSMEYKRIEVYSPQETAGEVRQEEIKEYPKEGVIVSPERGEKPAEVQGEAREREEKNLIEKTCKHCDETFLTDNPRKEYCSRKCKDKVFREKKKLG